MKYSPLFTLISVDGVRRHLELVDGAYAVGKKRKPATLSEAIRAVLLEGKGARFMTSGGTHKGVLSWSTARTICAYELDPGLAAQLGVAPTGRRPI
jgi:hypothetical protein